MVSGSPGRRGGVRRPLLRPAGLPEVPGGTAALGPGRKPGMVFIDDDVEREAEEAAWLSRRSDTDPEAGPPGH